MLIAALPGLPLPFSFGRQQPTAGKSVVQLFFERVFVKGLHVIIGYSYNP